MTTLANMQDAHNYEKDHKVRVLRDLCLLFATGSSLVQVLENAWHSGYEAYEEEQTCLTRRKEPSGPVQERTRQALARSETFHELATMRWEWDDESGSWCGAKGENMDSKVRPGDAGAVIVTEAGGEYSGTVITPDGSEYRFAEGTFR